jgi:1-acyl-sn-glycerol-3-phosphate acyltransferase
MKPIVTQLRAAATLVFMTTGALVMLLVAVLTLFQARRFYSEVMAAWLGRVVLRIWGVEFRVHGAPQSAAVQTVYVSNHSSTLDVFVLIGMGLPRTRFFLSGFLRKLPPIAIVGYLIRIFWTVPQEFPNRRRAIFKRADRVLRATHDSVYLSPEGMRITTGEIGHFNKGSFHLATSLRAQIAPMYFSIPSTIDPGMGYAAKPGVIDVYFLPTIDTVNWTLDDLELNRDAVRELFVRVHASMRRTGRLPESLTIERTVTPLAAEAFV